MTITNPFTDELDDYCFDEKPMYVLEGTFLHIYEPSYSGYKKITDNPFNLASLLCDKRGGSDYRYSIEAIEFFKGYLYFSWSYWDDNTSQYEYGITRIKSPDSTDIATWDLADCEWACTTEELPEIKIFEISNDKLFYCDENNHLFRRNYEVIPNDDLGYSIISLSSSNTQNDDWEIDPTSLGLDSFISGGFEISDIQLNGSTLYATVYKYKTYLIYTETDGVFDSGVYHASSNGGILKFPVNEEVFEPKVWNENIPVPKLLGWYTHPEIPNNPKLYRDYYSYNDTTEEFDGKVSLQPPLEQADKYFYGARKFIAKKPDELVIADDGAYIDYDNKKVNCKSRVVTVNLATESLSVVDVNVTFSSHFSSCSYLELK